MMLACVSTAPLGGPVVPLVYTSVATSSGRTGATRAMHEVAVGLECLHAECPQVVEREHQGIVQRDVGDVVEHHDVAQVDESLALLHHPAELLRALDEDHA